MDVDDDEFADLFDPEDIVISADAYDNEDLVAWLWENVLEPRDIVGIETYDGAIVFDPDIIKRNLAAEVAYTKLAPEEEERYKSRFSISEALDEDLDDVLDGTFQAENNELYIGNTSEFLTNVIGVDELDVTMPASKAYSAMVTEEKARRDGRYREGTNYHGLGKDGLLDVLRSSEEPVAAFAYTADEKGKRANRIVLVTDEVRAGKNIAVIEELETKGYRGGQRIDANKVITSYDRGTLVDDIVKAAADGRLLHLDKKRSQALNAGTRAANWREAIRSVDFDNNIRRFLQDVKWKKTENLAKTYVSGKDTVPEWKKKLREYEFSAAEENPVDAEEVPEYLEDIEKALEQSGAEVYTPETLDAVLKEAGLTDEEIDASGVMELADDGLYKKGTVDAGGEGAQRGGNGHGFRRRMENGGKLSVGNICGGA